MSNYSIATANKLIPCLICGQVQPKNSFLSHISEHLNYKQHKCLECNFTSVTPEEMADHEAANNGHIAQFHILRNPYMDRVCRFIYNDCDYGDRNGGLENVLKRKLASNEGETSNNLNKEQEKPHSFIQQQIDKTTTTAMKSEQLIKQSTTPIIKQPTKQKTSETQNNKPKDYSELGEQMQNIVVRIKTAISENEQVGITGVNNTNTCIQHTEVSNSEAMMPDDPEIIDIDDEEEDVEMSDHNVEEMFKNNLFHGKERNYKKQDDTYEYVQCLKCAEWVKGRAICLLYHINTRHLKLPIFRCLACPRDFYYVNDTAPRKHMLRSHNNDLSLFENNYIKYSKILRENRLEFYGEALMNELGVFSAQKKIEKKSNNSKSNGIKKIIVTPKSQATKNLNLPTTSNNINPLNNTTVSRILEQIRASQIAIPKVDNVLNSRKERMKMLAKRNNKTYNYL